MIKRLRANRTFRIWWHSLSALGACFATVGFMVGQLANPPIALMTALVAALEIRKVYTITKGQSHEP